MKMTQSLIFKVFALCALAVFCSCSMGAGPSSKALEIERVSVKDQALAEVEATPLEFVIKFQNDSAVWQRAKSFFSLYLEEEAVPGSRDKENHICSGSQRNPAYRYCIKRAPEKGGMRYQVKCLPLSSKAQPDFAERNARNLARFLRDGTLEVSLLER
ncbi:MAG: hypothetical protein GX589_02815 [Deltaproteobacteria bacterium]|nr:hypothetical protein [Deltaproteobacteria bacterium]